MDKLTEKQAFEAMFLFLKNYYERTHSDDVGGLLGDLILLEDGLPSDQAAWSDWTTCIQQVMSKQRCD